MTIHMQAIQGYRRGDVMFTAMPVGIHLTQEEQGQTAIAQVPVPGVVTDLYIDDTVANKATSTRYTT